VHHILVLVGFWFILLGALNAHPLSHVFTV